jgi:hypothetical protein
MGHTCIGKLAPGAGSLAFNHEGSHFFSSVLVDEVRHEVCMERSDRVGASVVVFIPQYESPFGRRASKARSESQILRSCVSSHCNTHNRLSPRLPHGGKMSDSFSSAMGMSADGFHESVGTPNKKSRQRGCLLDGVRPEDTSSRTDVDAMSNDAETAPSATGQRKSRMIWSDEVGTDDRGPPSGH